MQNLNPFNNMGLSLELFHLQTNTSFEFPSSLAVVLVGKPNDHSPPDIDVSNLPDAEVVSRVHAQIQQVGNSFFIQDLGSANGTFLNSIRLEPKTPYQLKLGDRIDLGQGSRVTLIFQDQARQQSNQATVLSTQTPKNNTVKLIGLAVMIAAIAILTGSIQVGLFVRTPGLLLCMAGLFILFQQRINQNWGWVLIALGIGTIFFTSNIFASANLFVVIGSVTLFLAGYQVFSTGKILDYDLRSLEELFKK